MRAVVPSFTSSSQANNRQPRSMAPTTASSGSTIFTCRSQASSKRVIPAVSPVCRKFSRFSTISHWFPSLSTASRRITSLSRQQAPQWSCTISLLFHSNSFTSQTLCTESSRCSTDCHSAVIPAHRKVSRLRLGEDDGWRKFRPKNSWRQRFINFIILSIKKMALRRLNSYCTIWSGPIKAMGKRGFSKNTITGNTFQAPDADHNCTASSENLLQ